MQHRCISMHMCPTLSACQSSGPVKWKLETHKHFFNRCSTGATIKLCTVKTSYLDLGLPHKSLPLKVFFLKIFNPTLPLLPLGLEILIAYQRRSWPLFNFMQINISMIIWSALLFASSELCLIKCCLNLTNSQHLERSWDPQYHFKPSTGTQRSKDCWSFTWVRTWT